MSMWIPFLQERERKASSPKKKKKKRKKEQKISLCELTDKIDAFWVIAVV